MHLGITHTDKFLINSFFCFFLFLQIISDETFASFLSGADAVEAQCKRFEVRSSEGGRVLFSADEDEIVIGADRLKVTGMVILWYLNEY